MCLRINTAYKHYFVKNGLEKCENAQYDFPSWHTHIFLHGTKPTYIKFI